jgi:predicted RNA-binding Zn-ribbon protein involved in translation (DUF1610 family)
VVRRLTAADDAATWLDAAATGDAKRLGAVLDAEAPGLKPGIVALARSRGVDLPDDAGGWPGKKLLRRALGRDVAARTVRSMIARDEGFTCVACGADVPPAGRTSRNHCPFCLASRHVDVVPGDRAAGCGGRMDAVGLALDHGHPVIVHRCVACGAERRVRALVSGRVADDARVLAALSARGGR